MSGGALRRGVLGGYWSYRHQPYVRWTGDRGMAVSAVGCGTFRARSHGCV